jgi:hypothetical protein
MNRAALALSRIENHAEALIALFLSLSLSDFLSPKTNSHNLIDLHSDLQNPPALNRLVLAEFLTHLHMDFDMFVDLRVNTRQTDRIEQDSPSQGNHISVSLKTLNSFVDLKRLFYNTKANQCCGVWKEGTIKFNITLLIASSHSALQERFEERFLDFSMDRREVILLKGFCSNHSPVNKPPQPCVPHQAPCMCHLLPNFLHCGSRRILL